MEQDERCRTKPDQCQLFEFVPMLCWSQVATRRSSTQLRTEFHEAVESLGNKLHVYDTPETPVIVHIGFVVNMLYPADSHEKFQACKKCIELFWAHERQPVTGLTIAYNVRGIDILSTMEYVVMHAWKHPNHTPAIYY